MRRLPVPVPLRAIRNRVSITDLLPRAVAVAAVCILAVILAAPLIASAAKITGKANPDIEENSALRIVFEGAIAPSDVSAVERVLSRYPRHTPHVDLDSEGGDMDAAMAIGRLLRARDATVSVDWIGDEKCLSSCVLIYAAGVKRKNSSQEMARLGSKSIFGTGIGIHRFYFASLREGATTAEIQASRNKQKERVRVYLSDMNVSSQLLDAMEATPPEKMRMLTVKELNAFGLSDKDPVFDEKEVARLAAYYGLTSAVYRKRAVEAEAYCSQRFSARDRKKLDFDALMSCEPDYIKAGRGLKN
jgi:hypothetical protein